MNINCGAPSDAAGSVCAGFMAVSLDCANVRCVRDQGQLCEQSPYLTKNLRDPVRGAYHYRMTSKSSLNGGDSTERLGIDAKPAGVCNECVL